MGINSNLHVCSNRNPFILCGERINFGNSLAPSVESSLILVRQVDCDRLCQKIAGRL